jgi:anti-sigma B factor antagonist
MTTPFRVSVSQHESSVACLAVDGELDMRTAPQVLDAILCVACGDHIREVTLDLSRVCFLDSSGLNALIIARNRLEADAVQVRLAAASEQVARLTALTGTASLFESCPSPVPPDEGAA